MQLKHALDKSAVPMDFCILVSFSNDDVDLFENNQCLFLDGEHNPEDSQSGSKE